MKNLTGKTLIFYTFQQKKQLDYNVVAYQPVQQPILIKDVIQQLPLNLSQGRYHFRFKSQFFQGNQKIAGWIDINNLAAKVPLVGSSIYVKILKVKSNIHNKMFNLQKLAKVGLGLSSNQRIRQVKAPQNTKVPKNNLIEQVKPVSPISISKPAQSKIPVLKNIQSNKSAQFNLIEDIPKKPVIQNQPKSQQTKANIPQQNNLNNRSAKKGQDLFEFQQVKIFKNEETTEQKLAFFKQTMAAQQLQKQNQLIARDELQQKIKKWGYSGAKTINNLTTLLSTLHDIWPEWPQISLTQLLKPQKLAQHTKKALIKTHPDKNRSKPFKQKYLSKRVFQLLNQAKKAANSS